MRYAIATLPFVSYVVVLGLRRRALNREFGSIEAMRRTLRALDPELRAVPSEDQAP